MTLASRVIHSHMSLRLHLCRIQSRFFFPYGLNLFTFDALFFSYPKETSHYVISVMRGSLRPLHARSHVRPNVCSQLAAPQNKWIRGREMAINCACVCVCVPPRWTWHLFHFGIYRSNFCMRLLHESITTCFCSVDCLTSHLFRLSENINSHRKHSYLSS